MWKPNHTHTPAVAPTPEPAHATPAAPAYKPITRAVASVIDQASIGKGVIVKGEITGSESLFIDGTVEGTINLPNNHVTVGRNGYVAASIIAHDIVVMGKVNGNVTALNRLDIRAEGSLTGDVTAVRLSIEDGAFINGSIDLNKTVSKQVTKAIAAPTPTPIEMPMPFQTVKPEAAKVRMRPVVQTA